MDIPISAAKKVALDYDYDQVIIIGRKVGRNEHVTTYGVDKANCAVAAKAGDFLKYKVMMWAKEDVAAKSGVASLQPTTAPCCSKATLPKVTSA